MLTLRQKFARRHLEKADRKPSAKLGGMWRKYMVFLTRWTRTTITYGMEVILGAVRPTTMRQWRSHSFRVRWPLQWLSVFAPPATGFGSIRQRRRLRSATRVVTYGRFSSQAG